MKLKELLEQYSDVELTEEQVKQVKDYLGIKESKKWKPRLNEKYFFIDSYGDVSDEYTDHEQNAEWDDYRIFTNNCFKTKKEAEFRLEQIKVYNELKNFADENNDEIDWKNECQEKHYIYLSHNNNNFIIGDIVYGQDIGQIYFSSIGLVERAIEKVGADRIKKYLFGVKDE